MEKASHGPLEFEIVHGVDRWKSRGFPRSTGIASSDPTLDSQPAGGLGHRLTCCRPCQPTKNPCKPRCFCGFAGVESEEAPVGVEPTMADFQSGVEARKPREKRRFRERCTQGCTQPFGRPRSGVSRGGMASSTRCHPGWHPRYGACQRAMTGGGPAPLPLPERPSPPDHPGRPVGIRTNDCPPTAASKPPGTDHRTPSGPPPQASRQERRP